MTESAVPMSPSQQGMFFDCQLREASDYHVALHLKMEPVSTERFALAVRRVMTEQAALRSAVRNGTDGVFYVVADSVEPPLASHDLREDAEELESIANETTRAPFRLDEAPLFRIAHCKLADEDRVILVCHHLIADGLSVSLLAERLVSLARAERLDLDAPIEPDPGFHWYQRKQEQAIPEKRSARQKRFWEENLAKQETPDLSHWMRSGSGEGTGRELRLAIDPALRDAVGACAREAEVSENTVYLGTFGVLLGHYAHADHVSVATPFADRPALEMEQSIGCFIKTLPVHIDTGPNQTIREMLERLGAEVLGTWKHLSYPVTNLLGEAPSLNGVHDVTFIQDSYPGYPEGVTGTARHDRVHFPGKFTVLIERIGADAELVLQYKESALSEDQVERFARRYLALLERISAALDDQVAAIRPTPEPEAATLLRELSKTHYFDWEPQHLGSVFREKTVNDPARTAWTDRAREYSNAWAHDAAVLVQRRVVAAVGGERRPVAILLPRGADLLAGVFGTMLAGCPYVPLSEAMPASRVAEMLDDASVTAVLTTSDTAIDLPEGIARLDLDEWDEFTAMRADTRTRIGERPLEVDCGPDHVLYIEYTSGSTGRPKGVMVTHANVQNTAMDLERRFPLGEDDVYLLKTAFTFDIFGTEIYGWLFGAGRLDVLPAGHEGDPPALLHAVRERAITHINFSPTLLRVLLDAADSTGRAADLSSLRYVFSGGEALTADIVERFFELPLHCTLENVYGPTEATMWATHGTITAEDTDQVVPIGTPLNDYRIHILDRDGGLCGVDVPGEVCIIGAGVALGYLNREELNAAKFVENPFFDPSADPAHMRRMYRTGDLGLLRGDGRFAFLGRMDRQVKVGGVRMELGEIEQALLGVDGVVEAAVVVDDRSDPSRLAGFYTARRELPVRGVRAELAETLMPHMIPSVLHKTDALPTSTAGKLDHRALLEQLPGKEERSEKPAHSATPLEERIARLWRRVLETEHVDHDGSFFEHGGNSISLMNLQAELQEEFGSEIRITDLLKHHSVASQARLFATAETEAPAPRRRDRSGGDIAVIGIGVQVPGAEDVHRFWENLQGGGEHITFYDDRELRDLGVPEGDLRDPDYVKAKGRIDGIDEFDDALFAIPPAEVAVTSPQLRLLYKCFWHACEDAGYDPRALPGRVGVFVGGNDDFAWYRRALMGSASFGDVYQNFTLATNHFLSTRLSYRFDLRGPSMSTLSGCSTSLLTVHQAAQALRAGECDMAVAGGVTVELPNDGGYRYVDGMMLSPDGHCRPFDSEAAGTVFSNGASLLMLKPVEAALRDGDPVYAVIKGSAVGNDGGDKPSYTAPSENGQYETIRAAYETSGIDPSSVSYVEAHGTGTLLGDPIEVASLSRVFEDGPAGECLLGSVKGNVGHTDSAAGSVGLSKVALSLKHRYVPGTRNYTEPNPNIDFASTPFEVTGEGRAWHGRRLRAGINSFGVGGTNVHMIVEEAPDIEMTDDNPYELLQFSAASPEALERTAERVARHVADRESVSISDAAHTLRNGRAELPYRKTVLVEAGEPRESWAERTAASGIARAAEGARTALLFSGQGNQYRAMGLGLYESDTRYGSTFRHWMDELIGLLPDGEAIVFRDVLYGEADDGRVDRTEWSQFALFSTQFAAAKVLESFGVRPDVLAGHSIGELTAAALAGVWSLPDAVGLVRERGRLMQAQRPGVMLAAAAPAERVRQVVDGMDDVWISLHNSAERSVLGMTAEAFDAVVDRLEDAGVRGSRLHTSHAFHTPMMAEAAGAFAAAVAGVESHDPSIPIVSNRSGETVRPGEMTDPSYWSDHVIGAVRFEESLRTLLSDGPLHGIELGPGRSLSTFAAHDPQRRPDQVFVNVLRHAVEQTSDEAALLASLGRLWSAGAAIDWRPLDTGRKISLPGYSFDRTVHVQDTLPATEPAPEPASTEPATTAQPQIAVAPDALQGVREAFRHVLGFEDVAPDADFFALGGDSLKATGLSAQLENRLGISITVADIFASPTPAALAARFSRTDALAVLPKAPAAEDYPLSPAQTRMYIAAKTDPERLVYNMPSATLLRGFLDHDRVRTALRRLVERHEPLRTTFAVRDGEVRQRIGAPENFGALPLRFSRADHTAEGALDALLAAFVKPFDLETGPLFRMEIVDGGPAGALLLFDIHHIIADAVSVEVITRDFSRLHTEELEPLPLQYTDFVMHGRAEERQSALAESEERLLAALDDVPTDDLLATDHPRGHREAEAGRVVLQLDSIRLGDVQALAEVHDATPFMVLLSAWGAVLSRYADRDDLVIGVPVTGRTMAQTQEMIGMFVNMMPIRLRPSAASSFGEYLGRSRTSVLEALSHQDVPFDRLVEKLRLPRVPGRHPLFDISFDYHNMDHHDLAIDGVTAEPIEIEPLAVGMDLVITCTESPDGLTVHVDFAADLFERATIEQLTGHFDALLGRVCADDSQPLERVSVYSNAALAKVRSRLNPVPFTPIHDLIAARAAASPDATAVIDASGEHYTYAQIDGMANAQAAGLHEAGAEPGEPVALFTVRDVNLLIAQLAILKAGCCYLPIDPTQPRARHESIIADLRPRFAFAPSGTASTTLIDTVFDMDACTEEILPVFDSHPSAPDDPIYTVHTSGSTGVPKGIVVKHRGVLNLFDDHRRRELFAPGDVIVSLADPTFDIFTFESLFPLASGASVHMCPSEDRKDAAAIADRIAEHGVSHIQLPVSKMSALCGNRRFRAQLPALRVVVCGGEHFSENLLALLREETGARVFNMYGPTETTVTATVKEFGPGDEVTIGSAVSGAEVLIVGEHGMIQPDGVPGELCIAGEGLAAGYTNNPDQNRRSFTALRELPGVPVYRTGDAGVRLPNREVILKGRLDHQVKVNGNRIELGEIEQTAMRAEGVTYAVAAVEDGDLVLYYTAADASDRSEAIRSRIARALPGYMNPEHLRRVDEMPKLHNHKIDREALRRKQPATDEPATPGPAQRPRTPAATEVLGEILTAWEAVLGHTVRPSDNFFDVGGNSYKLMLVGNRLGEALDTDVPFMTLFENPTPRSLAEALGAPAAPEAELEAEPAAITLADTTDWADWAAERTTAEHLAADRKIAVIGMAGVFPGAENVAEHWDNRAGGTVSISRFTRDELLASGLDEAVVDDPRYVGARGHVEADTFDAEFFGYSAKEAETLDPQMRLLHQTTWHALEDAGYVPGEHPGDIALFAGSGTNFAWMARFLGRKDDPIGAFEAMTMNEKDFLATKIAYKLDLTGPALNVQTACSTSLVAVHQAVHCLRQGQADMALAGGVALNFPRKEGYTWHEGMIFSEDGVCRPFSQDAEGTVGGQGCGVVLLKPLDRALADGDHVYAVIAGSAANNDGSVKVGYTAPGVRGQEQVIRSALEDAAVDADEVGYVETHGTGTKLGDPIEYAALSAFYGRGGPCALGAAKANIGHLDAAAGIAGLIGAVGVLHRGEIPPMANFRTLNERMNQDGSLYVPSEKVVPEGGVRMAAVSSFGIGGTNAHLILESAPPREERPREEAEEHVFPVSARTEHSRRRMQDAIERCREEHAPRDVSHTLAHGRAEFDSRAAAFAAPGKPLAWIEQADPPLALDASDDVRLTVADRLLEDPAGADLREAVERELAVFDERLRHAVRTAALEEPATGAVTDVAIERLAQFTVRAALVRLAGPEGLHARTGADRMLRIARASARGDLGPAEAVRALKTGTAPTGDPEPPAVAPNIMDGPLDSRLLKRLLASRWVHHGEVDRSRFCVEGRRVPLPGYAFDGRPFVSDVRLDELGGTAATQPERSTTADPDALQDILRDAWIEVLGAEPVDHDDFFHSGGDSLSGARLCSLIEGRTGVALTVADCFADARYSAIRSLLAQRAAANRPEPEPVAASPEAPTSPASPAQKRMYAACELQHDTTAYNLAIAYEATGGLDVERLRSVFGRLVARHEQLRTSFHLEGGELVQRVHPEVPDVVSLIELTREEAQARLEAEPRPFDLAAAPLIRVEILAVEDDRHYLLIDMHHIVGDQQSLAILAGDVATALQGEDLPEPGMRYADYVQALAAREATGETGRDVERLTAMLDGEAPRLELPADKAPPEPAAFDGERHGIVCEADRRAVAELAKACGATSYMVFLTALTRLLGLYSGQREFVLGTALSGRSIPGSDRIVGMFVNTLPLKVTDASEQTVREAVEAAKDTTLTVLDHQNAPFEAVLSALGLQADGEAGPLFDVVLNYVRTGTEELELDGVRLRALPPGRIKSKYALSITVVEHADRFAIDFEYRTELFEDRTIARMAERLDRLLLAMTADPDALVRALPLETSEEHADRRAVLTAAGPSVEDSLIDRTRASFERHADLPALRWEQREWTYAELDRITDDLAGGLQAAGVGAGDFVLCLLDRDPWQIFTRLALMKCGAVEIPLNPDVPSARVAGTIEDSGAALVLASDPRAHSWPEGVAAHRPQDLTGRYLPPSGITGASPLVMIYTSGTTGRPKGTLCTHGGALSTCVDNGYIDYRPGERILHLTAYTFDGSVLDLYSALLNGATLVMGRHEHNMDMALLTDLLREERIDKGLVITAVFNLLMAENPEAIADMSALYVGGEAMQPWAAKQAFQILGPGRLYNLYGPTEVSVVTTHHRLDEAPDRARVPIGRAARNRTLYIVHPDGTDVPRGVPGELCVAGPGLALGYHRRPELTAEKFTDSLGDLPERVYRTGDRVVLDESDRIVYLDRGDRQIKHAGYRIELSEIEMALQRCPGVADTVVIHTNERNDSRLTAFYTGESAPDEADLRRALSARLPHYMVPHRLIRRRSLPITSHGKVDRRRLAAEIRPTEPPAPRPGRTDQEILAAFRTVLNAPDLTATDDFFEAGAQSLQAIAVVRRLRETGMELQVGDLYRHPTAEGLSKELWRSPQTADEHRREHRPLDIEPARLHLMVDWAAADGRRAAEAFADQAPSYDFAIGAMARLHRSSGAETGGFMHTIAGAEPEDLTEALAALAARHEALRARVNGERFAVLDPDGVRSLAALVPVVDLRRLDEDRRGEFTDALAHELQTGPFGEGLPWRCVILRESDDSTRLMWAFHHGVFDGFSAGIIRDELPRLLRGEELEDAPPYSRFLADIETRHDWQSEPDSFDCEAWLAANRALMETAKPEAPAERLSLPLDGRNPLELALRTAHAQLSQRCGRESIAVGLVADCRRWRGEDYTDCVGEFLDVVPVLLRGEGDQEAASRRFEHARRQGLHYVQSLSCVTETEGPLAELRAVYHNDSGRLDLALVNFQGHLDPGEVPESGPHGPTPAALHLNVWHDDTSLHLEWASADTDSEPTGENA